MNYQAKWAIEHVATCFSWAITALAIAWIVSSVASCTVAESALNHHTPTPQSGKEQR